MPSPDSSPDPQARRRASWRLGAIVLASVAVLALAAVELAAGASAQPSPIGVICGLTAS